MNDMGRNLVIDTVRHVDWTGQRKCYTVVVIVVVHKRTKTIRDYVGLHAYIDVSGHRSKIKWRSAPSPIDTWENLTHKINPGLIS